MTDLLSLHHVRFHYEDPEHEVLTGLSLSIPDNTITSLLGPNGAGKTTLLHTMLGLLQPSAGEVLFAGRPWDSYTRQEQSRLIGLVPQTEQAAFEFSVLDYVLLGRTPYLGMMELPRAADYEAAEAALAFVGIAHLRKRTVTTLSGGERQMVAVARALAQHPHLLLLDEPTAHLDLGNRGRIISMMRQLRAEGLTVVFTTHDPNIAAMVADNVILMRQGQVLHCGPRDRVLNSVSLHQTYGVPVLVTQIKGQLVIIAKEI